MDFRGRLNCIPEYLNYQSSDLAKGDKRSLSPLLLFSKGSSFYMSDKLSIDYLKIYGATCFGVSKKSRVDRINWVNSNH